jgi:trimethylamine--corrinoid protein Co-methyltransferase
MAELRTDDEALALDEIIAVGPGGNHLARPYTRRHFREIWQSDLFETTVYDRWRSEGSATLLDRLRQRVAALRAEPRAFQLDEPTKQQLAGIMDAAAAERPEA